MPIIRKTKYFNNSATIYEYQCDQNRHDIYLFVRQIMNKMKRAIKRQLKRHPAGIRWWCLTSVEFVKPALTKDGTDQKILSHFWSKPNTTVFVRGNIKEKLRQGLTKMIESMEKFTKKGSGWIFKKCRKLELRIVRFQPMAPARYVPLPALLKSKRSILNIRNSDEKCFLYCILAALHPMIKNAEKATKYKQYEHELNMNGLQHPIHPKKMDTFERQNPTISVNVFGWMNSIIIPLRISQRLDRTTHIDLLYIKNQQQEHYCLIRNFNMLMNTFVRIKRNKTFYCQRCLQHFGMERLLTEHSKYCQLHDAQRVEMPTNKILKFEKPQYGLKKPFVIYADFECFNVTRKRKITDKTHQLTEHRASGVGFIVINSLGEIHSGPHIYSGENVVETFLKMLIEEGLVMASDIQSDVV